MRKAPIDMQRVRAKHLALRDQFEAERHKPPTRKQMQAWLEPMRKAFREIKTGYVDSHRGYAVTRIHHADNDVARVDHCINGFVGMLSRIAPEFDVSALTKVSKKLEAGVLLTVAEIDACFATLNAAEDRLMCFTRAQLKDAATTEMIHIDFQRMGLAA